MHQDQRHTRQVLLLLSFMAALPIAAYKRVAIAHPAPKNIAIDGALEEWNLGITSLSPPIDLEPGFIEEGTITSSNDHQATLFVAYGAADLYIAAIVTDDHVQSEREIWRGDMVEVLVERPGGYFHVGLSPGGVADQFAPPPKATDELVQVAASIEAPGYLIEARIPYSLIGGKPKERLAINFASRDADPKEAPPAHRVWSGYRHNRLASFGELRLAQPPSTAKTDLSKCTPQGPEIAIQEPIKVNGERLVAGDRTLTLRIMNFQSAKKSWAAFWTDYDPKQVERDLETARGLGANTVRIFPPFSVFTSQPLAKANLAHLLEASRARGLLVIPSLFPDKKEFHKEAYAQMEAHVVDMATTFAGDPTIIMWDLMNEADHGFGLAGAVYTPAEVYAWSKHMAAALKTADPTHLVTIGLAGYFANHDGPLRAEEVLHVGDVLSLHWYFEPARIDAALARAKTAANGAPLVLQEFGVTSMYEDGASASALIDRYCAAAQKAKVSGVGVWELFDHPVGSIGYVKPRYTDTDENHYGLFTVDGIAKPQAAAFCRCLRDLPRFNIAKKKQP